MPISHTRAQLPRGVRHRLYQNRLSPPRPGSPLPPHSSRASHHIQAVTCNRTQAVAFKPSIPARSKPPALEQQQAAASESPLAVELQPSIASEQPLATCHGVRAIDCKSVTAEYASVSQQNTRPSRHHPLPSRSLSSNLSPLWQPHVSQAPL